MRKRRFHDRDELVRYIMRAQRRRSTRLAAQVIVDGLR